MTCKITNPITKQKWIQFYTEYIAQLIPMIVQPEGEENHQFDSSVENDL